MRGGMRRVGLIARADNRGLGQQTWAFYRNMRPAKTLVVDCPSQQPLPLHLDRFPGATVTSNGFPTRREIDEFLDGVDIVYTAETGYGQHLWDAAHQGGVDTVLHINYEFFVESDRPTVFAAPTLWHIEDLPESTIYLPVPIETDRMKPREVKSVAASRFLHVVGRPAIHDRNGTPEVFEALQYVRSDVTVVIACQQRGYVESLQRKYRIPDHVTVEVRSIDRVNYWENYLDADALLMPRRFGGLCLPAQEAVGCGLPVIMPDISPNGWLPADWLVPASYAGSFDAKQPVDIYLSDPPAVAERVDLLAQDANYYAEAVDKALLLRRRLSWETQRAHYAEVFER